MKRKRIYRYYTFGCSTDSYAEAQRLSQENGTKIKCYKLIFSNGKKLERQSSAQLRNCVKAQLRKYNIHKFDDADLYNERVCYQIYKYIFAYIASV